MSGIENKANLARLQNGMDQHEVLSLLGTPESVFQNGNSDKWVYEFRNAGQKGSNHFVEFQNGKVSASGEISGREVASEENRTPGTCTRWYNKEFRFESLCFR
jgi:outer membrane protein assembly factor BamE (lipoprotein component of BamABCDE complex)